MEESIAFYGFLLAALACAFAAGRSNDLARLVLGVLMVACMSGAIGFRHQESSGKFATAERFFEEGSRWQVEWKQKTNSGFSAVVKNLDGKQSRAIRFRHEPPEKFITGKVKGWFGWREIELKSLD